MKQVIMAVDIGSSNISCAIAEVIDGSPKIIGVGFAKSQGIRKGAITYIEQAVHSIKSAIADAKRMSGAETNRAIVSISGNYIKSRNSSAVVTVTTGEIGCNEIKRAIQTALHNATIPEEYVAIHVLPYQFVLDEQELVDDPNGMSGSRLKVFVHIVTIQKTALENLRRVAKVAGIEIENIVLSSYASSIAVLSEDEKELGVACIDIGGDTCDVMIHSGHSMCYDGVLAVGSNHITRDIAHACNTSTHTAEELKIGYGDITNLYEDNLKTFEIPVIGGEKKQQIPYKLLSEVIYTRLIETFSLLYEMIDQNELKNQIGAGIVFTGGIAQIKGIGDFIDALFRDYPTRLAIPREIEGMPEELKNPMCSTVVGLILYGSGRFTNYELDSEKRLKIKKSKLFTQEELRLHPQESESDTSASDLFNNDMLVKTNNREPLLDRWKKKLGKLF